MTEDEIILIAIRKVKEIQSQAGEIANGNTSNQFIENFASNSIEVSDFIEKNIPSDEIKRYLKELPLISFKSPHRGFWQSLLSPSSWIALYKGYGTKSKVIEEIRYAKHKYENLELLLKGLTG